MVKRRGGERRREGSRLRGIKGSIRGEEERNYEKTMRRTKPYE